MKIYVGGSLRDVPVDADLCMEFIEKLGARIAEHGHTLLTGCRGSLDKAIAASANQWLEGSGKDVKEIRRRIISYKLKADDAIHNFGRVQVSKRADWSLTTPDLSLPEQIAEADVAIFVAVVIC